MSLREWVYRLRPGRSDHDLESEMRVHIEMETEAGRQRGLSDDEARRQAVLRAGSVASAMEKARDQRTASWVSGTAADIRHAMTGLLRQPQFPLVAGAVLTIAVAANTLIFAMVYGVLLKPLPYRDPERLVRLFEWSERNPRFPLSILNYLEDRRHSRTLESIALYTSGDMELAHGDRPERLTGVRITHDFLPTLGVQPAVGRNFEEKELVRSARVVILGDALWRSRFAADPGIVGRTVRLNRENWTVIGVMPKGFQHPGGSYRSPLHGETVDVWCPLPVDVSDQALRFSHYTNAIARLKAGVPLQAATEDLNHVMDELTRRHPDAYTRRRARVEPLAAEVVGRSGTTVQLILAAGLIVMAVACINIAGLCVARVIARKGELAIRQALGAGRMQLIRTVLAENLILGFAGGIAGFALAALTIPVLRSVLPAQFPRLHEIDVNAVAGAYAVTVALVTSLLAGILPALRNTGEAPGQNLGAGVRVTNAGHGIRSLRGALVVAEVALGCVLCFCAVLLVRSGMQLNARDHGFQPSGVVTFRLQLPGSSYNDATKVGNFVSHLMRGWREIPGVMAVGAGSAIPWTGYDENAGITIPGRAAKPGESMQTRYQTATPGYFEALRWPLRRGRLFQESDGPGTNPVAIVNETLARRFFEGTSPVGRYINYFGRSREIVGVVADVRDDPADTRAEPAVWLAAVQEAEPRMTVVVRSAGDALAVVPQLRDKLAKFDPDLPIAEVRTMEGVVGTALAERRFALFVCQAFAALGLLLAAIGIYGLLTYLVQQRRKEIGIRMALGASNGAVLWMVTGSGVRLAAAGVVAGLLLSPPAARAMSTLLYGVSATDAVTLVATPLPLLITALVASGVPGWMAARTEPLPALRDQ
ncbi:MAG TPA: ABC transporter permease [Bryobacteraceae bacterium]|nr:ABC transporter permease [Bryobacteraceae bacterium]